MKIIVLICEGKTDTSFLSVLLKSEMEFLDYSNKTILSKIKEPLGSYLLHMFNDYEYEDFKVFERPPIPIILRKNSANSEIFCLIYSADGKNKINNYKQIITFFRDIASLSSNPNKFALKSGVTSSISLCLFFDADKKGIRPTVEEVKNNYSNFLPEIEQIAHNTNIKTNTFKSIGCYILFGNDEVGTLEDIIIPLMKDGNETIFDSAIKYLNDNNFTREEGKLDVEQKKSAIGVAGQLELSGLDNGDIIRKSKYLSGKLKNEKCIEIKNFIKEAINNTKT